MPAPDPAAEFVRDALQRGLPEPDIRAALRRANWTTPEIDAALASWTLDETAGVVPSFRMVVSMGIGARKKMSFLPKDVLEGLEAARKRDMKQKTRLRVSVGERSFPVLDMSDTGFALDLENAPNLRGLVDLYRGAEHLYQCLIVAHEPDGTLMRYSFKRMTAATDKAPLDYAKRADAPVALIENNAKA